MVKNVALSVDKLKSAYPVADLQADKDLADFVAVAQDRRRRLRTCRRVAAAPVE